MKDQYKNIAKWYDRIIEPLNRSLKQIGLKMYPPKAGMDVLDIGCGTGSHLKLYQDKGCNVFGIDLSEAMLNVARQKLGDKADLQFLDATNTTFSDNKFDLILCSTVLHEMPHQVRLNTLNEAKRILKKDGRILLIDFHPGPSRKFKGFYSKIIISIVEFSAGGEHYRNYRHFISIGGLPNLIENSKFVIEDKKIVSGGNIGIFLLNNVRSM